MTSTLIQYTPQTIMQQHTKSNQEWINSYRNNSKTSANSRTSDNNTSGYSGLKKIIMKMLVFDENDNNNSNNNNNSSGHSDGISKANNLKFSNLFSSRNNKTTTNMSLLKFFAINALELSAPATPVLLQHSNVSTGWLQLSGHPQSIESIANGIVRKRVSSASDCEVIAYRGISKDIYASRVIPKFLGISNINNETYIELQDLLHGFKDPNVMDIKMGSRTFLESEVSQKVLRPDLYKKMIAVDPTAPTQDEHNLKAVTKLRYMMFREQLSSSQTKGFRIEALKMKGYSPVTDLKTLKGDTEIESIISHFTNGNRNVTTELLKCLKQLRANIEKSEFFKCHEIVGSSVFIVYDDQQIGAWLIDFAKCRRLPDGIKTDHRRQWIPGNCEEGLLHGMDELIKSFESVKQHAL